MKKSFIILGMILTIAGCGKEIEKNEKKEEKIKIEQNIPANEKELVTFKREDNKEIVTLESSNYFETGILTIGNKKIEMIEAVSGSGVRLVSKNNEIEVHFKGKEGILSLDGKDINLTVEE